MCFLVAGLFAFGSSSYRLFADLDTKLFFQKTVFPLWYKRIPVICQALSMKQELHKRLIIHEGLTPACQHFPPRAYSSLCLGCESHPCLFLMSLRLGLAITLSAKSPAKAVSEAAHSGLCVLILALRRLKQEDLGLRPAWAA